MDIEHRNDKGTDYVPDTLLDALAYFNDEERCHAFLVQMRWADGIVCPRCQSNIHSYISTRRRWHCITCGKQYSVRTGTIMEASPLSLSKWLAAIWLISNARNGISSCEIARAIGVTQKTAWFLLHRIRFAMDQGSLDKPGGRAAGVWEVDEMHVGGRAQGMHRSRWQEVRRRPNKGKEIVLGVKEQKRRKEGRHSTVRTRHVPDTQGPTLKEAVRAHVPKGSKLYSDESPSYPGMSEYHHETVNHQAGEYVRGEVWTNGIENFWGLFKRCVRGTYTFVTPRHLTRYLSEVEFRFNQRERTDKGRFKLVSGSIEGKRLTYQQLTEKPEPLAEWTGEGSDEEARIIYDLLQQADEG